MASSEKCKVESQAVSHRLVFCESKSLLFKLRRPETLDWSAVETAPEPCAFWMLLTAPLLLELSRWAQLSLRKLSKS